MDLTYREIADSVSWITSRLNSNMEKTTALNQTVKSGLWYTISSFIVKAMGLITTPIFTRLLTHAQYGDYSNYISWQNILVILVTLHLEATLISAKHDYEDFDNYIFSVLTLSTVSVAIWAAVLNIFYNVTSGITSLDRIQLNCMVVYMLFYPALQLFLSRERYMYRYKRNVILSIAYSISMALLSVILVLAMTDRLEGRILGNVIPTAAIGIALYIYFILKGKRKINFSCWKYALPLALPYIPHLLSMTVLGSTDRIMIRSICGSEDAALYSLAYSCGAIITLLITSLNNAYAPWLGDKLNSGNLKRIRQFSYMYIGGFSIMAFLLMLVTPEVLLIMGGRSYMSAIYVMPPVAMGCVCQFMYTMFVNVEQFKKNTLWMAFASAIAAALNIVLNLLLIPRFGYIAAGYTTLIGYLCLLIMHMLIVRRMKMAEVYNYKFVISVVAIMCACTFVVAFLYQFLLVRWIVICAVVCVLLILARKYKDTLRAVLFKRK